MLHYRIHKRMFYVYLIVLITFLVIILRVFYLQVFKVHNIKDKADSLWSRNLPILADRGKITDRNGIVLADNLTTTSLVVIPVQIQNKEEVSSTDLFVLARACARIYVDI